MFEIAAISIRNAMNDVTKIRFWNAYRLFYGYSEQCLFGWYFFFTFEGESGLTLDKFSWI